jgi:hypothetical protein
MTITVARDVRAWLVRRSAPLLLAVTTAGMIGGGAAWLAGADGTADAAWLATAACGLGYALWVAVASLAHGRVSVDVIALLALAGAIAVDELLAAAVISVMLTSGRTLEAWAAYRARHDLSALLERAPRTGRRYRDGSLETVPLDEIAAGDLLLVAAGDVIPVDGTLAAGVAVLDESALTGEALPVQHVQGDTLRSGALNAAPALSRRPDDRGRQDMARGLVKRGREGQDLCRPQGVDGHDGRHGGLPRGERPRLVDQHRGAPGEAFEHCAVLHHDAAARRRRQAGDQGDRCREDERARRGDDQDGHRPFGAAQRPCRRGYGQAQRQEPHRVTVGEPDEAVILNALRALRPIASAGRMTDADVALTRRFRAEHQLIRADIEQLRIGADALTTDPLAAPAAMAQARHAHTLLTGEVWPHESAEEADLYPALNRLLGGTDPTAAMSRAHAEIAYQIARLGRLLSDIGDRAPDEADITDLREVLYGLYAILRLHTVQEDEAYLSLGDDAETVPPGIVRGGKP